MASFAFGVDRKSWTVDGPVIPWQVPVDTGHFLPGTHQIWTAIGMKNLEDTVRLANRL